MQRTPTRNLRPRVNQSQTIKPTNIPQPKRNSIDTKNQRISNQFSADYLNGEIQELKQSIETQKQETIKSAERMCKEIKKQFTDQENSATSKIKEDFQELKSKMQAQKDHFEKLIKEMNIEMKKKCAKYEKVIEQITSEMNQIKKQQHETDKLMHILNASKLKFTLPMGFNKSIHGGSIENVKNENNSSALEKRINDIEIRNEKMEEAMLNLVEMVENCLIGNGTENTDIIVNDYAEKHDQIANEFQCINADLNKINVAIFKSEEKITKMYAQIHVLSAKYIKFNEKICNFIANVNKHTINLDANGVIDKETLPFFETHNAAQQSNSKKTLKKISSSEQRANPFKQPIDNFEYTRIIKINAENTNIVNIDTFVAEFKHDFEKVMGSNIIKTIATNKYQMNRGIITNVSVIIMLAVPLNLQYINNFKFPKNWFFYTVTAQKRANAINRRQRRLKSQLERTIHQTTSK